ncbi:Hpt domain-containing protein [Maridesulfovibrio hydrothermalis]|uniref:Hpt protein n=1 Tax=Maridesulfovibrio hydrothermalis AM13 = DSM 14728 TaxID=1121451 RepID=L0REI6_9BACT|nr:Hpt domain-containing protein [Maridesulfovibrio hydrothermalis]CCO24605.1 Hpt protein [Maridesulfovibrio hydrothermalis AM13 = DSM 14728]
MNNLEVINKEWLDSMASTKKEFLTKLFSVFLRDEPARVSKIRVALESESMDELKFLAHSLKGAAATMGADRVREACLNLEYSARDGDKKLSMKNLAQLEHEMKLVYDFMTEFVH